MNFRDRSSVNGYRLATVAGNLVLRKQDQDLALKRNYEDEFELD